MEMSLKYINELKETKSADRKLSRLEVALGPKKLTHGEREEWEIASKVYLPYAKELATKGKDPSFYLLEIKKRSPINLDNNINEIIKIYIKNHQPTFSF